MIIYASIISAVASAGVTQALNLALSTAAVVYAKVAGGENNTHGKAAQ